MLKSSRKNKGFYLKFDFLDKMVEVKQKVTNLSRNLRSMKFMRRGENAIDLDAEASELKTRPEQWFREVPPIESKIVVEEAGISECMDLR